MLYNEQNRNGRWYNGRPMTPGEADGWYAEEAEKADAPEPPDMPEGQMPPDAGQGTDTPPAAPDAAEPGRRDGPFTAETPFSTRYFVLRFQADGTLVQVDLTKIASVTEDDTAAYLTAALDAL